MRYKFKYMLILVTCVMASYSFAQDQVTFSSNENQNFMIELFTSQGCSSCPPAEYWLNAFKNNELLWNEIVPIAFHVDYWDKLGWPDPYANHAHSMRQYRYRQQDHLSSVYTPGVLVNGREWRGWLRGEKFPPANESVGVLSFTANPERILVEYSKVAKDKVLNVALLGVGIITKVARGENKNKALHQDFVVLSHEMYSYAKLNSAGIWSIPMLTYMLNGVENNHAEKYALAVWVSNTDSIAPIQSTGYWLPEEWFQHQGIH